MLGRLFSSCKSREPLHCGAPPSSSSGFFVMEQGPRSAGSVVPQGPSAPSAVVAVQGLLFPRHVESSATRDQKWSGMHVKVDS